MFGRNFTILSLVALSVLLVGCNNEKKEEEKKTESVVTAKKSQKHHEPTKSETSEKKKKRQSKKKNVTKEKEEKVAEKTLDDKLSGADLPNSDATESKQLVSEKQAASEVKKTVPEEKAGPEAHLKVDQVKGQNVKKKSKESVEKKEASKNPDKKLTDEELVQKKLTEIQNLTPERLPTWVAAYAATVVIKSRIFGPLWKTLTQEQQKEFTQTLPKFMSINVVAFLPMIKDYSAKTVNCSKSGKKVKEFTIKMENSKTKEVISVTVFTTSSLRIIDIVVLDVSLLSILQTTAHDILNKAGDKIENWKSFLQKM
jgi:hypothetical protein